MTSAQEAEAVELRDSREARQRAVDELRERRDRLNAQTMRVPCEDIAGSDKASRDAGSADTAYRLGLQASESIDEMVRESAVYNPDFGLGQINAHVLTLCRCLCESRRLEP